MVRSWSNLLNIFNSNQVKSNAKFKFEVKCVLHNEFLDLVKNTPATYAKGSYACQLTAKTHLLQKWIIQWQQVLKNQADQSIPNLFKELESDST